MPRTPKDIGRRVATGTALFGEPWDLFFDVFPWTFVTISLENKMKHDVSKLVLTKLQLEIFCLPEG